MTATKPWKVLVIEDEPMIIDLIKLILRTDNVQSAISGREGLAMAEDDPPDLIILDLSLPDTASSSNWDEFEVCRRLKANPKLQHTRILLMEGFTPDQVYPKAKQAGALGYLVKPFGVHQLLAARDAILGGKTYYLLEKYYFSSEILDTDPDCDKFVRDWCTKFLQAMDEPSLVHPDRQWETYRFLWLRTFHHPIAIRLEHHCSDCALVVKELDGRGGYEPGEICRNISRIIRDQERAKFLSLLDRAHYWELLSGTMFGHLDSALWVLEGYCNGKYHVVSRHSPRNREANMAFCEACLYLLDLSGIGATSIKVY